MEAEVILNPGSNGAVDAGCTCPVLDNHYGRGFPYGEDGAICFWLDDYCPMHGGEEHEESHED